jgi:hypothetical protein
MKTSVVRRVWNLYRLVLWKVTGPKGSMPELLKQRTVRLYAKASGAQTLVETGTYLGEMVKANVQFFSRIYSVELDPGLAAAAAKRFANTDTVSILQGESGTILPRILSDVSGKCLFWLDAHYSGGVTAGDNQDPPIVDELHAILAHGRSDHVILIDDGRLFDGSNGYPTIDGISKIVAASDRGYEVSNALDIIRVHQPGLSVEV